MYAPGVFINLLFLDFSVQKHSDERLKLLNEVLRSIKIIKLNCWESVFAKKINNIREKELQYFRIDSFYWTVICELFEAIQPLIFSISLSFLFSSYSDTNRIWIADLNHFNHSFLRQRWRDHSAHCIPNNNLSGLIQSLDHRPIYIPIDRARNN